MEEQIEALQKENNELRVRVKELDALQAVPPPALATVPKRAKSKAVAAS